MHSDQPDYVANLNCSAGIVMGMNWPGDTLSKRQECFTQPEHAAAASEPAIVYAINSRCDVVKRAVYSTAGYVRAVLSS